ncbi:MAG: ATP-binding protein [ANME-2 cluster archaeon]|nr:ATP-binding protein [ANME-2 cluster archaeon]MBC2702683.1 ATP-binding protein [ANME-2 cluster archaeon]MBC2707968.1 ATP-binding protein [ANME-2 cluster archaeon]MBC2746518.1 ATP-binding protein [ANME-2 cluster archaeon]MBC2762589.1 ATP-binding protein [ANME-2 cluster archaeon]
MQKNQILEILLDWNFWAKEVNTGITREEYLNTLISLITKTNQIICIAGIRRSGKSTLIKQIARQLIDQQNADTLIVNFEDERFLQRDLKLLIDTYNTYLEKVKPKGKPFIFLDEIQNIPGWERFARGVHERTGTKIIVSGSSSKLLSAELATLLTGRHIMFFIYPLSFKEFLKFKNIPIANEIEILTNRTTIMQMLDEYKEYGGFPEVVQSHDKQRILLSYFETMIVRDVIERFNIREREKIRTIAKFYLTNISSPISFNKISGFLNIPLTTVERFSGHLETANVVFFLKKFSFSFKEQEKAQRKIYSADVGLSNTIGFRFSENLGKIMENIAAVELKRRQSFDPQIEIYYWKDYQQREVDFVVKKGLDVVQLIQICHDITSIGTKERETKSLIRAMKEFKLTEGLIITDDFESEEEIKGFKIKYVPMWKWLLLDRMV